MAEFMVNLFSFLYRVRLFLYKKIDSSNWGAFGKHSCIKLPFCKIEGKRNIKIGNNCIIEKNARIEAIISYAGGQYSPTIIIEDNVCINQNFHCTCADSIIIGSGTSITANCGIFDIIHPYEDITINPREAKIKVKPIRIGKDCLVGMNSVILPGTILGNHCVVGANSVVLGIFPDYSVLAGSPAKVIKRYDLSTHIWRKTNPQGEFLD